MIVLYVSIIVILILLIILYVYPTIFYSVPTKTNAKVFDLSLSSSIFDSPSEFELNNSSTFQGFVYIDPLQRTSTAMLCDKEGYPSCVTGRFDVCSCKTLNCDSCRRTGYIPILQIGDTCTLEILPAPDAGRQGKAMAQLSIRTQSSSFDTSSQLYDASGNLYDASGNLYDGPGKPPPRMLIDPLGNSYYLYNEVFALPPIPLQKWTMITIVRDGRRFHIYYNNGVVLSQQTNYPIARTISETNVSCGNTSLNGKATLFSLNPSSQSGSQIASTYSQITDARGVPYVNTGPLSYLQTGIGSSLNNIKMPSVSFCPSGGCVQPPTMRPAKPWLEWNTNYA
jgi:hypothetical protein